MPQTTTMRRAARRPRPSPPAEAVFRTALVNRLRAAHGYSAITIVAPAGYGKSTLLRQWEDRDERPFVRLPAAEVPAGSVVVVDDAAQIDDDTARALSALISDGSGTVVLAGRSLPALPGVTLARLRARGRLLEVDQQALAFTRRETRVFLKARGAWTGDRETADLVLRTEGWAAGIGHAATSYRLSGTLDGNGITRAFFRNELLAELRPELRAFLRQTSVLDRLSAPLCDHLLERGGSALLLDELDREGLFLVPLDHRGEWYRYHRLLRDELQRSLDREEPGLAKELHRRAADWYETTGDAGGAIRHAVSAGTTPATVRAFGAGAIEVRDEGRADELDDWLAHLDEQALRRSPHAAVVAARLHAHRGRTTDAERCLGLARNGAKPKAALVRAALCANGPETMLADAERGLAGLGREDRWHAYGLMLSGTAHSLLGAAADADAVLAEAVHSAGRTGAAETLLLARCQRALAAGGHVPETKGFDDYATTAPVLALAAQEALRAGLWADARGAITRAQTLMHGLTDALPWLAVQARLALASAHVMLRDADSARALLGEADLILAVRDLGRLQAERDALAKEIGSIPPSRDGHATRLTGAELRLLPLLATHLSFREIGARLFLSRHTVKTQAISAYRKLGATSRKEAVIRASQLGLIEPVSDLQTLAA